MIKQLLKNLLFRIRPVTRRLALAPATLLEEMPDHPALFDQYRFLLAAGHKRVPGGWIYDNEFYPDYLTVGGASLAIRRTALKFCVGCGLDIGAGFWPFPGATPIDDTRGPGLTTTLDAISEASQDYVFSSHCLEHIADWNRALDLWISKLRPGGVLFLYLPHPSCGLWHKSNPFMSEVHVWVPTPEIIADALIAKGLEIVGRDDGPDHFYSFYVCGRL